MQRLKEIINYYLEDSVSLEKIIRICGHGIDEKFIDAFRHGLNAVLSMIATLENVDSKIIPIPITKRVCPLCSGEFGKLFLNEGKFIIECSTPNCGYSQNFPLHKN